MARRKSHHKKKPTTKRRRRSRVGAINQQSKEFLMTTIGGIAGAVAGQFVGKTVSNMFAKNATTEQYAEYGSAAVQIGVAFFLPKLVKQKSPMITGLQIGMAANGGLTLVKKLNIIPGIGAVPMVGYMPRKMIAGVNDMATAVRPTPMVGRVSTRHAGRMNMA